MASFDIVCKVDLQEIDNAVNLVLRELTNRYDFKGAKFSLDIDSKNNQITINAEDDYKLSQIQASLRASVVKRGIDAKALEFGKEEAASGNSIRQIVKIKQGVDQENAKKIVKEIKNQKLKKVQISIRGDELRADGKKLDDLQEAISLIKSMNIDLPLQFINFRS
ncbi:MAG: YajQ family cyclic di-GMP-binding protein [Proteobacteria bacterium]|nr:YajQ family cyclic di-GMP-binding protein [Pseudomonadota bacterium]